MMSRTQVSLDREMLRRARSRAGELGISLAEYIRRLLARDLGEPGPGIDPSSIFNLGRSGGGGADVAVGKEAMLREAAAVERRRGRE
jgi:hypothetical protein